MAQKQQNLCMGEGPDMHYFGGNIFRPRGSNQQHENVASPSAKNVHSEQTSLPQGCLPLPCMDLTFLGGWLPSPECMEPRGPVWGRGGGGVSFRYDSLSWDFNPHASLLPDPLFLSAVCPGVAGFLPVSAISSCFFPSPASPARVSNAAVPYGRTPVCLTSPLMFSWFYHVTV